MSLYDALNLATHLLDKYKSRRLKKIPVGAFIRKVEMKLKIKLSKNSKEDLIQGLRNKGIHIVTSKNGRKYIILGEII